MNDTFSPQRFGWLLKKTILEKSIQILGLTGLSLIISLIIYAIIKNIVGFEQGQVMSFIVGFVVGGTFLASLVFNYFSSNSSGSSYLTLPASHFEKWLCGILIAGVLFPFIFLCFYHFMDLVFISLYHKGLDPKEAFYKEKYNAVFPFSMRSFIAIKAIIMYVNFSGAMLIGSLYFNKGSFIKVALIGCGLIVGSVFINFFIAKSILTNVDWALPYYCAFINVGKERGKLLLPETASLTVDICLMYIIPAILWLTPLVRLREKEF